MASKTNYTKNGKRYYRTTATLGRDSDGKLIRKEFYGLNKSDAENKKDEYLNNIKNGLNINFDKACLGDLMHTWLFEVKKIAVKPSTFTRYEGIFRIYIKSSGLYQMKLDDLKSIQIQRYYNNLANNGKSASVIKNLNKLLKSFFNYAVDEGYLLRNPCIGKKVVIPGAKEETKREIKIFTNEEIHSLNKALENHRLNALILLALGTGLRQGELLGLKWSDIDFDKKVLKVQRSIKEVYFISENGTRELKTIEQSPKTKNSIRTVPIPSSLIPILNKQTTQQKLDKLKVGSSYTKSDYVFTTQLGTTINAQNLTKSYKRILEKAKIPYKKFHSLRHTYATKLFEKNVPIKTVQMLLGHSDISTTSNIYTHVMPEKKIDAVEKLNDLFII
ncbi:MAG: tyrosine-type recombinase/integrase [Clostridium sp.]|nr:tyrosine-type recombinase/integrase [Clostridium sp.]